MYWTRLIFVPSPSSVMISTFVCSERVEPRKTTHWVISDPINLTLLERRAVRWVILCFVAHLSNIGGLSEALHNSVLRIHATVSILPKHKKERHAIVVVFILRGMKLLYSPVREGRRWRRPAWHRTGASCCRSRIHSAENVWRVAMSIIENEFTHLEHTLEVYTSNRVFMNGMIQYLVCSVLSFLIIFPSEVLFTDY